MDATDKDEAYNPFLWPVLGMYQPDAIASFAVSGKTYYITANEGDAREYFVDANDNDEYDDGEAGYVEEVRVDDLTLEFGLSGFMNSILSILPLTKQYRINST